MAFVVGTFLVITLVLVWLSYRIIRSNWHRLLKVFILIVTIPAALFFGAGTVYSIFVPTSPEAIAQREAVAEKRAVEREALAEKRAEEREAAEALERAEKAALNEERAVEREAAEAVELAEKAEKKRKGFHCLSEWDGSHAEFKRAVKEMMRNPSSFEHVETRVTPVREGEHTVMMTYRAENGFGGVNIGQAVGTYSNNTCAFTIVSVE